MSLFVDLLRFTPVGRWLLAMLAWFSMGAAQAATIQWDVARSAVYDPTYCCTLRNDMPLNAQTGGFDLAGAVMAADGTRADIVINAYGSLGAGGVVALNESFDAPTTTDPGSYATTVSLRAGGVYLVVTRDGKRAKLRVDTITAGKVYFTYRLQLAQPQPAASVSYLITCDRATYPGGVSCAAPVSVGARMAFAEVDAFFRYYAGCSALGSNAYYCGASSALEPGYVMVYQFTDTTVSRVVYMR